MQISVNDLVVHRDQEPLGRLIRVAKIEPWPRVLDSELAEDATARCHGTMLVFDRLVASPPASVDEFRQATADEIVLADRQGLLPPSIDNGQGDGIGDREPRNPHPQAGTGGAALPLPGDSGSAR
jgi:hypothetical protein